MSEASSGGRSDRGRSAVSGRHITKTAVVGRWSARSRVIKSRGAWMSARSAVSGRYVSQAELSAAAGARVSADKKRGVKTESWIVDLAAADD